MGVLIYIQNKYLKNVCTAPLTPGGEKNFFGHGHGHDSHSGGQAETEFMGVAKGKAREGINRTHIPSKEEKLI